MLTILWLGRIKNRAGLLPAGEGEREKKQSGEEEEEGGVHRVQMGRGMPNCEYYWDVG